MNRRPVSALRIALLAVLAAAAWVVLGLFLGATSASAADTDSQNDSLFGASSLGDVTQPLVSDVLAVIPQVASVVTDAAAAQPVTETVDPVAELADSVVTEVPVVGDLANAILGDAPVQSVTTPVTGVVDDGLVSVAGVVSDTSGATVDVVGSVLPPADTETVQPDPETVDPVAPVNSDLPTATAPAPDPAAIDTGRIDIRNSVGLIAGSDLSARAASSALAGTAPLDDPSRSPAHEKPPLAVLPAQSGSSAGPGGASGSMFVADASPMNLPPAYVDSLLSASVDEVLPSSPTFDPGCTPD